MTEPDRRPHPTGTVTFLFTDIEGSTRLWEQQRELMREAFPRQEAILRGAIAGHGGFAYKMIGDAFQAAFPSANAALEAAIAAQRRLAAENWGALGALRVRMALDSGAVEERPDDYVGPLLNRLGRLLAAAHGGQILLSATAAELARPQLPPDVTLRPLGRYRLRDLLHPESILQAVVPDLPSVFPPLRGAVPVDATIPARPGLPHMPLPLIGRRDELRALTRLLARPAVRLVTIVAPGGAGKTRLALAALERLRQDDDTFPHGVACADLAPLLSAEHLDTTLAEALDLPLFTGDAPARTPRQQLLDYLREKRLLLLLDRCEHLHDALVDLVGDILTEARGVTLLATSGARLGLRVERPLPLDGLPEEPAVELFVAAARLARPGFALDEAGRPIVAAICARLCGLPLAIELAAGWAGSLSPAEIAAALGAGPPEAQPPAALERELVVRTLCDATWGRLPAPERGALARIAVFHGGAAPGAIQAVTGAGQALLQVLVGDALLRHDPERDRYVTHELVQQYAAERLAEEPAVMVAARERHAACFLAALAEREAALHGPEQARALDEIDAELANVRAAWRWAAEAGRADLLAPAAGALGHFYELRGRYAEGLAAFTLAREQLPAQPEIRLLRAEVLAWCGAFSRPLGDRELAERAVDAALALLGNGAAGQPAEVRLRAFAQLQRGHLNARTDRVAAEAALVRGLELASAAGDRRLVARALAALGGLMLEQADFGRAEQCWRECLTARRELGGPLGIAAALAALSLIARHQGRIAENVRLAQESYELYQGTGNRLLAAYGTLYLARAIHWAGEMPRAAELLTSVAAAFRELGDPAGLVETLYQRGGILALLGRYEEAEADVRIGLARAELLNDRASMGYCRWLLAMIALGRGAYPEAERELFAALPLLQSMRRMEWVGRAYSIAADIARLRDRPARAWGWVAAALRLGLQYRSFLSITFATRAAAALLADAGKVEQAIELGALARPFMYGRWAEDLYYTQLDALAAALPKERAAAAVERGRQRDPWAAAAALLAEIEAAGWDRPPAPQP